MQLKKITLSAMILTLAYLIPQVFHLLAIPQAGMIFLPMHLPIFIGGIVLGPSYGLILGILAPLVNMLLTGMPPVQRIVFMIIELATYGWASGYFYKKFHAQSFQMILTLMISIILGRVTYAVSLYIAMLVFHIPMGGWLSLLDAFIMGIPGIIAQFIFVPLCVNAIQKYIL